MFLYLVQHGEARSKEEDPARGLSEKGLDNARKAADYAGRLGINVYQIFHSGKTRALQTAQVFVDYLKPENGISEQDGLAPADDPHTWFERLSNADKDTMLVGHLPHLSKLSALLLCGDTEKTVIGFKNACIVCLKKVDESDWSLEWMITPEFIA
jgi:phosphohistidine phosphatase